MQPVHSDTLMDRVVQSDSGVASVLKILHLAALKHGLLKISDEEYEFTIDHGKCTIIECWPNEERLFSEKSLCSVPHELSKDFNFNIIAARVLENECNSPTDIPAYVKQ